jgi:hypothetical protein
MEWLLDEREPSMRYRTLTELEGRSGSDPEVRDAKERIPTTGWAAEILSKRSPEGWWARGEKLYTPKYLSTNWQLLMLSDLGLTRELALVRDSCELWMARCATAGGGVGAISGSTPHHCMAGNQARALIRFGYADDPRVRRTLEWLVETASPRGGWSCFGSGRTLDSWEGLSAFAVYPREKWTRGMQTAVERAAEFYLERELVRQGEHYEPWYRFHYPVHYYYDLLVGLDLLTSLGYASDPRLGDALAHLRKKRRADGRWNLDAVHPDVDGGRAAWFEQHPRDRPVPTALEVAGRPSKMITLTALKVLARVDAGGGPGLQVG